MKCGFATKVLTLCLALAALVVAGCGQDTVEKKYINIATGGTAGTYYPIGGAIAEILNKNISGMNASAQATGATVSNINMIYAEDADLAIVQNDIIYYAVHGTEMFSDKEVKNIRGIASLYPETCQFVTLESSGIKSVEDLRGKRVAVGAAGSGAEANARQILEVYGMTYNDIEPQYLSFAEGANALMAGNVDAAFLTAGYPTASVNDIAAKNTIRLLPVEDGFIDALIEKYPFYTKTVIPAGTYQGFDEDVSSVSVMAMLVASSELDDKLGYAITKAIFTNTDRLESAHAVGKFITKETAKDGMPIELNAGAVRFYDEK